MYNILVLDDEFWIRKWLENEIGQLKNVNIIECCENVEEASQVVKEQPVDIIITDINMPVVSGLDFVKSIKLRKQAEPQIIVISGYDNFDYVKEAIQLNVLAYILKPIDKGELFEAIDKAIKNIEKKQKQIMINTDYVERALSNSIATVNDEFQIMDKEKMMRVLSVIDLKGDYYICGMLQSKSLENEQLTKDRIKATLRSVTDAKDILLIKKDKLTYLYVVLGLKLKVIKNFKSKCTEHFENEFYLSFSNEYKDINHIEKAFIETRNKLMIKFNLENKNKEMLFSMQDIHLSFLEAIKRKKKDVVKEQSKMVVTLYRCNDYDVEGCLIFYFVLVGEVIKHISRIFKENKDDESFRLIEEGYQYLVDNKKNYSIKVIAQSFEEYFMRVIDKMNTFEYKSIDEIVKEVQSFVNKRYDMDVNLASVSERFNVNSSYLSKKFKDITGVNFIEYLTLIRMEKAKKLLISSNMSIKSISQKVGFNDPKYFSKVFILNVGEKPSKYRQQNDKGEAIEEDA